MKFLIISHKDELDAHLSFPDSKDQPTYDGTLVKEVQLESPAAEQLESLRDTPDWNEHAKIACTTFLLAYEHASSGDTDGFVLNQAIAKAKKQKVLCAESSANMRARTLYIMLVEAKQAKLIINESILNRIIEAAMAAGRPSAKRIL